MQHKSESPYMALQVSCASSTATLRLQFPLRILAISVSFKDTELREVTSKSSSADTSESLLKRQSSPRTY